MSDFEEDVLLSCLERARAWEDLHNPDRVGEMNAEEFLLLCRAAGIEEKVAQKAATDRAFRRLQMDLSP